jgi:hypothetical protein
VIVFVFCGATFSFIQQTTTTATQMEFKFDQTKGTISGPQLYGLSVQGIKTISQDTKNPTLARFYFDPKKHDFHPGFLDEHHCLITEGKITTEFLQQLENHLSSSMMEQEKEKEDDIMTILSEKVIGNETKYIVTIIKQSSSLVEKTGAHFMMHQILMQRCDSSRFTNFLIDCLKSLPSECERKLTLTDPVLSKTKNPALCDTKSHVIMKRFKNDLFLLTFETFQSIEYNLHQSSQCLFTRKSIEGFVGLPTESFQ